MLKRIFGSKFLIFLLSVVLLGFLVGYDYAMVTSGQEEEHTINASNAVESKDVTEVDEDIRTYEEIRDTDDEEVLQGTD